MNFFSSIIYIFFIIILNHWINSQEAFSAPKESKARIHYKNITSTNSQLEIKPSFIENGKSVLFLVFIGDSLSPKPWDYRLAKSDREGHTSFYLTTRGVLDYSVLSNDDGILVLKAAPSVINNSKNYSYEEIQGWELWYLNLQSGEMILLEASPDLPISLGYQMLGLGIYPDLFSDEYLMTSPKNTVQFIMHREIEQEASFFKFYNTFEIVKGKEFFKTDIWNSYSQRPWLPTVTWLNETTLFTVKFESKQDSIFPQSQGVFSIIKINLKSQTQEVLYKDSFLNPFPKFVLNPDTTELYFQRLDENQDNTELWRINLGTKIPEKIYEVKGELGEVRFSLDGSSLVLTQLQKNNFDIIRIDLNRNAIQRLVDK